MVKVQAHSSLNTVKVQVQRPESSGSQFFKTSTRIDRTDTFDKAMLAMTFLTILGVPEILHSFRLVLEGKIGNRILELSRLEFLEKFLENNFTLSDAKDKTYRPLNR